MLRIGDFSKLAKISIKTLRYYDKIGLLKPAMIDSSTQYRYYTVEQLETVRTISMYKDVGLSNDMISKLIYQKEDKHSMLQYQKQILLERAEDIKKALSTLEALLDNNQGQRYEARVVHLEKRLMCFSRGYIANVGCIHDFIKCCLAELKKQIPTWDSPSRITVASFTPTTDIGNRIYSLNMPNRLIAREKTRAL